MFDSSIAARAQVYIKLRAYTILVVMRKSVGNWGGLVWRSCCCYADSIPPNVLVHSIGYLWISA